VRVQATSESPPLWLLARGAAFIAAGDWYWGLLLRQERDRGYDHVEDLYQPGTFRATLSPGGTLTFLASAEDPTQGMPDPDGALAGRRSVHAHAVAASRGLVALPGSSGGLTELAGALRGAVEQFIVRLALPVPGRQPAVSLIAGYHWFADWTRDAMIALPGLLLSTGRIDQAASLLRSVASYIDQGLVPNTFPDTGDPPDYAAADASLLFFRALQATLAASADDALLGDLYPKLQEIIVWHMRGTRFGIGVDPEDGLLRAGQSGADGPPAQLTWMDACLSMSR
jgi:predicted glycogen debranching enzyme